LLFKKALSVEELKVFKNLVSEIIAESFSILDKPAEKAEINASFNI